MFNLVDGDRHAIFVQSTHLVVEVCRIAFVYLETLQIVHSVIIVHNSDYIYILCGCRHAHNLRPDTLIYAPLHHTDGAFSQSEDVLFILTLEVDQPFLEVDGTFRLVFHPFRAHKIILIYVL
ncbi:unknown [Prevotella sp. CAG:873]|nr:unknown [Prevotella sp. CAG:873]